MDVRFNTFGQGNIDPFRTRTLMTNYTVRPVPLGTVTGGTITPQISRGLIQTLTVNASFTLASPIDNESGFTEIIMTNGTAGSYVLTATTGYTVVGAGTFSGAASIVNFALITKVGSTSYIEFGQPA